MSMQFKLLNKILMNNIKNSSFVKQRNKFANITTIIFSTCLVTNNEK